MAITDYIQSGLPANSKLITTAEPIVQLDDNRLYMLATASEEARELATNIAKWIDHHADLPGRYVNSYSFTALDDELYTTQKEVSDAIENDGYDLIMQLFCPGQAKCHYLLTRTDGGNIPMNIDRMFRTADHATELCMDEVLHRLPRMPRLPACGIIAGTLNFRGSVNLGAGATAFHRDESMTRRIIENVNKARKNNDREAKAELEHMFRNVPSEFMVELFMSMSPTQLQRAAMKFDPDVYAEKSRLEIRICKPEDQKGYTAPVNNRLKNDGVYQLFLSKGAHTEHIHFSHKSAFVVYLIYLIDRYKHGQKSNPIDLLDKEKEYQKLYNAVYPYDTEAYNSYCTLVSDFRSGTSERRQKRLSDCFCDIRVAIGNACVRLEENAIPHIIENSWSHIHTRPDSISVSHELIGIT